MVNVEVFLHCPRAELIKQDHSSIVAINFFEDLIRVCNLDAPLAQDGSSHLELLFADSPVIAGVDGAEDTPVLIVLSEI